MILTLRRSSRERVPVARAHRRFTPRQSARLTQWISPPQQNYVAVATGGATLISSFPAEEPLTFMRTRGMVSVRPAAFTADLTVCGAVGIGIVSAEAFAAGVGSIPEPYTDADWGGWFMWRSFCYRFEFEDATGTMLGSWDFEVDSKAMRKVSPNEVAVFIAESQFGGFSVADCTRQLVKLS